MNIDMPAVIPIREQIFESIKDAILTNEYKPGDIIQIDRLAKVFGVSATPIREALIRLENSGLLTLIPNKGAKVVEISDDDIKNTWEMRKILEPYAGRLSAKFDLIKEIRLLETEISMIFEGNYDQHSYISADNKLHQLLFSHIDNSLLRETIQRIHNFSMRMRYHAENFTKSNKDVVMEVCVEHIKILEALKSGNPDLTEKTIRTHLENGEQRTLVSMHKQE